MKKYPTLFLFFLLCILWLLFSPCIASAAEALSEKESEDTLELTLDGILEQSNQRALDDLLSNTSLPRSVTFSGLVRGLMTGRIPFQPETVRTYVTDLFFSEILNQKQMALQILLIVLSSAVFSNFIRVFEKSQIAEISFYMIFETHAHYDDEAFEADREELLDSMQENGIDRIVNACASLESLKDTEALMEKYPFVYGAFGIHPDDADKMTEETLEEIRKLCKLPKAVAVGEIVLDYYWHKEEHEHEIQKKMFRAQMEIAREAQMPFMIHSREAAKDTLDIVKDCMKGGMHGGIIHCFSYAKEMAREYLDMGLYLGIGGVVTFKNAKKLKEVVEYAPLDQIVLETDSPYLSPEPNRGKRNDSRNLVYVAREIARIKGVTEDEVIAVTEGNAERLLLR